MGPGGGGSYSARGAVTAAAASGVPSVADSVLRSFCTSGLGDSRGGVVQGRVSLSLACRSSCSCLKVRYFCETCASSSASCSLSSPSSSCCNHMQLHSLARAHTACNVLVLVHACCCP